MIVALIVYFITFCLVVKLKNSKPKYEPFPPLKLNKNGVCFYSKATHMIKIYNSKTMLNNKTLYITTEDKLVIVSNIKNVMVYNNNLYFTSCGQTKIFFDCKCFYRFFAIDIKSEQFSLNALKQRAILDILNNNFKLSASCCATQKYINIIESVLNITLSNNKLVVKPNRFKFSFIVVYKVNNKIKRVNINQTL